MSKTELFSESEEGNVILTGVDIDEVTEKIVNDLKTINLDTCKKVDYFKARVAEIIWFYKRQTVDKVCWTNSTTGIEQVRRRSMSEFGKGMSGLYEKAKLDTNFIHLFDRAETEKTKHHISKRLIENNLSLLKDKTVEKLHQIDDKSKTLTTIAKSSVQDYVYNQPSSNGVGGKLLSFQESNEQTRGLIDRTKRSVRENFNVFLTNPTGKMTEEEIESGKFIMDNLVQFEKKIKDDLQTRKEQLDETIGTISNKVLSLLPLQGKDDDDVDKDE